MHFGPFRQISFEKKKKSCLLSISMLHTSISRILFFSFENCRATIKSCVTHKNAHITPQLPDIFYLLLYFVWISWIIPCVCVGKILLWVFSAIQFAHESKTHFVLKILVWLSVKHKWTVTFSSLSIQYNDAASAEMMRCDSKNALINSFCVSISIVAVAVVVTLIEYIACVCSFETYGHVFPICRLVVEREMFFHISQ